MFWISQLQSLAELFHKSEAHWVYGHVYSCPCFNPCTNICKRISAINRVITTLPRAVKTICDSQESNQHKTRISFVQDKSFNQFSWNFPAQNFKTGLLKITLKYKSELVVTHTCTNSIFITSWNIFHICIVYIVENKFRPAQRGNNYIFRDGVSRCRWCHIWCRNISLKIEF